MKVSPTYRSLYRLKVFSACLLSLLMIMAPMAPLAASVNRIAATRAEQKAARARAKVAQKQPAPPEALKRSLFVAQPPLAGPPVISATLTDSFVDTAPADGRADPNSTITYTAVVSNTGGSDATGVNFSDTIDPNTTLVPGSSKVSPLAFADSYGATTDAALNVGAPGVLTNDTGIPAPTAVPLAAGSPTAQGGTVTLNADGSFSYLSASGFSGTDTFTYSATNGQAPNDTATVTINVGAANATPVANDDSVSATEAGGVANGTAGTNPAGNVVLGTGSAGAVADTDAEDPSSALVVVQVHTGPEGGSTGTGVVGSPLAGSYGSLTLNSNGSYTYTVDNNNAAVQALRTSGQTLADVFNYTIQDTGGLQSTATFTVTISGANDNPTAVADTPTAVEAGGTANGTAGTDPSGNVLTNDTDVDSVANGETKTVQGVAVGNQPGPLSTNVGVGLSGAGAVNYGTLTIMADGSFTYVVNQTNATVEALGVGQSVIDTFSYTMKDAASVTSTTTVTVTIQGADDNPVAVNDSATVNEDAAATAVTVLTNDTDGDGGPKNIASLNQPANGTVVGVGPSGAFTGLTYQPNANYCNNPPGSTLDTFTYTLNGGSTATVSMTVTCINDAPTFTKGADQNILEDAGPQTAAGWATGIGPGGGADEAGQTLTFVITNNTNSALFLSGPSVAANGTLTYTAAANAFGTATITIKITDNGPTGGLNVNESATQTFIINVGAVNDAPVVDLNGIAGGIDVAAAFTEDSGGVTLAPAATVSDVDDTNLESATITLTNRPDGVAESLSVDTTGTSIVAAAYDSGTGVLALSGTDTLAHYQQVIRTAKYNNTSQSPNTTSRSITFTVNDGDVDSAVATATVTVTSVNDAPVVDLNGTGTGGINTTATFTEDGGAIVMAGSTDVTDVDNNNLVSATITLTNRPDGALESLSVDTTGTLITADAYVPGTGVLFLHGTDTVANYQQVLRTAKYNNTDQDPDTTARLVNFKANDGALDSAVATATITVIAVNDAPVLAAIEGGNLTYTENDAATSITASMTVADVDSPTLSSATITISNNFQSGQDVLSFTNAAGMGNIAVQSNVGGVLTLTSAGNTATVANWQTALRAVKYSNSSDDPNTSTRTVTFQVNDAGAVNNLSNTQARNITVVAVNDPPTAFGFTNLPAQAGIPIAYPAGKLGGSDLEAGTTITIDTVPINVTNGTVVINANGSFTFTPLPGTAGGTNNASFQYRVSDNGNPGPGVNGNYVTVSFNPAGPAIYFTKSVAVAPGNCTLGAECTIATAVTNIGASTNANIFIEDANTQSPGNITLNSGGSIIGQGVVAASFDSFFGIGAPAQGTLAGRPNVNQTRPTINGAATITAHNSTQLRGFNYTPTGNGLVAASRTNLVVGDMNITSTSNTGGQFAVNFTSSTGTFTFGPITVSGANVGGGVNFGGTTSASTVSFNNITTAGGPAFQSLASNGTTNFTFNDITSTTGIGVAVTGGSGSFTFHAINVNGASKGASLIGSYAGAFSITGTSTTAGSGGTIQSISGRGIEIVGPAAGQKPSVSIKNVNLTTTAQTNGDATTTNCGATGPSGGNANCSAAVHLNNVNGATFDNVNINGSNQNGINGLNVIDLKILNSVVQNCGNESGESGVFIQNLSGNNSAITNSSFTGNESWQFSFMNWNAGTLGTLANPFNISGSTFTGKGNTFTLNEDGILGETRSSGTAYVNVTGSHFKSNYSYGAIFYAIDTSNSTYNITGCDFGTLGTTSTYNNSGAAAVLGGGATLNYNISTNTIHGSGFGTPGNGTPIIISTATTVAGASIIGTISGNTIGATSGTGFAGSGCHGNCNGISLYANGGGPMIFKSTVTSNSINQVSAFGIQYIGGFPSAASAVTGTLHINSNTITPPEGGSSIGQAMLIQAAQSGTPSPSTLCADIGNGGANTLTGIWDTPNNDFIRLLTLGGSSFTIGGMPGAGTATTAEVNAFVSSQNGGVLTTSSNTGSGGGTFNKNNGAVCPLLLGEGGVMAALHAPSLLAGLVESSTGPSEPTVDALRSMATAATTVTASLNQQQLDSIVAAAAERWMATGLTQEQISRLRGIKFDVADLAGGYLGESGESHVQIDRNAGGKGWYTESGASSDLLFSRAVSTTRRYTDPTSAPAGHIDLLTAIEHEMGHKLGLDDKYGERDRDNLMYGYLTVGERRLPASGQAQNAKPGTQATQHLKLRPASAASIRTVNRLSGKPITPLSGETVNVSIGTLPAGKSVTITFQVTLNTAMPVGTNQVTTQGTVTYNSGPPPIANSDGGNAGAANGLGPDAVVLTDDPGVGTNSAGETDPTVTPIDAPTAAGSTVSGRIVDSNGNPVEGAGIRMSGTQNRLTVTDAQGFYHFDNVEAGGLYTVVATRANFSFSPAQRSFSVLGQTTDAAFNASPTGSTLNPLDTTEYFVRQQYVDFLNREPDEAGLNFWYNNIESCGNDAQCRAGKRTDTSAAFFLSIEFQQTGYLVYKSYQAAFGDLPGMPVPVRVSEFKPDTQEIGNGVIVNAPGWDTTLSANKAAFMAEFVQRSRFANAFPSSMTPSDFVNKLFANAGVTPSDTDRTAAVSEFGSAGTSSDVAARGRALQRVAENSMLTQQEFTQAFVLIQYFGYLRRDPNTGPDADFSGYNFWLQKLNTFNGNFGAAEMVKSFLISGEYRGRFPR